MRSCVGLAGELLQRDREPDPLEQGAHRERLEPARGGRTHGSDEVEAIPVRIAEEHGAARHPARLLQAGDDDLDHLRALERVSEPSPQVADARLEVVALAEEELIDPCLELVLERLEQHEEHDRGEDEEKDDREHGADRRQVHAEERDEVRERERHRERPDRREEADPVADRTRWALLAAPPERDERGGEEAEDVEVDAAERQRLDRGAVLFERREGDREHRNADRRRDLREPRAGCFRRG